ncbi:hypothetical protein OYT88_06175 [Sporolactobacillus sp. CQH2019]|uniref:hypothetical protein n=1 Tax=Sporolactobacillus sp. CQH2019 TaxID=3023512 RepID=UPI002367E8D5|nr:hypothetical protein [Sporolactobacillus sp. CQH2019]MDD9148133.1 hypothetical protein [Sporolactobacillus sp. CQH2019]
MALEQSIDNLATALNRLAAALSDKSAEALAREQKWSEAKTESFPPEEKPLQHPDEDPKPKYTGTKCSVCGELQFDTPSGISCKNGHGGAAPATETAEPPIKLETVRAKLAKLAQAGKQKEVKALITSFGFKKLSAIPAEKFAEVLKKAEEIA